MSTGDDRKSEDGGGRRRIKPESDATEWTVSRERVEEDCEACLESYVNTGADRTS